MTRESPSILRGGPSNWNTGHTIRKLEITLAIFCPTWNTWVFELLRKKGDDNKSLPINNFDIWYCFISICLHERIQHIIICICSLLPFPHPHLSHFQCTECLYVWQLPLLSRRSKSASTLAMVSQRLLQQPSLPPFCPKPVAQHFIPTL